MDKNKKPSIDDILRFAEKYIEFFREEFGKSKESYYRFFDGEEFPEDCRSLGFKMDCGQSFIEAYGEKAWNEVEGLRKKIDDINDIIIIGNALFSQWRYFNHWSSPSHANEDTKDWFQILLRRLNLICNNYYQKTI